MKTKGLFYGLLCSLLLLLSMTGRVSADTPVSGVICSDTTWTLAGNPYIVTGNVVVCSGATLTIEPDVTVKFDSGRALQIDGTLIARGTGSSNITFTSNQSTPAPGDWGYILFSDSSTDATYDADGNYTGGSILEYVVVEYAGGASVSNNGAVRMDNAHPLVNYCTIRNNSALGVIAYNQSGTLKIMNSAISNNTALSHSGGIFADGGTVTLSNNNISNNKVTGTYWISGGGVSVIGSTVTISNNTINHNYTYNYGGGGITVYRSTATILNNIINNNTGGSSGGIFAYESTAAISNNTISYNSGYGGGGIYVGRGSATIVNNTIITQQHMMVVV